MKYVVQLSYTNPAHEHVSLRRRVDTVNRIVEAANENQAILRASQQQRSLGFMIKEAKIVKEKEKMKKKEVVVADGEKTEVAAAGGMKEEVEQVDEANMRFDYEAAARPKSSDVKNFLNRDKNPRAAAASKKYIRRMTKLGGLGPNQTKKDTEAHMKAQFEEVVTEASKEGKDVMRNMRASLKSMDLRHGVDSDKRDAGYKMSPAVRAAQKKSDALSKVVKRPQAGTLAAAKMRNEEVEYIEEKLTAGDSASKWISDFVASDNPKFAGKTKKERINMALGAYYAAKKGKNEEVELDEAQKKLKPYHWRAEWRLGTETDVDKNNKKIFDKLAKTDPVKASAFHDNLMRMKKKDVKEEVDEATDPGKLRVVNKKVEAQASKETKTSEKKSKATEKAINAAKSKKNPVNLKPVLAADKVNNA